MVPALLLIAVAQTGPSPFIERSGVAALVATTTTADELVVAVGEQLRFHSRLHVRRAEEAGVDIEAFKACGGRFSCWVDVASPVESLNFVVVANVASDSSGFVRASLAILDLELGRLILARPGLSDVGRDDEIYRSAIVFRRYDMNNHPNAPERFVKRLRSLLTKTGKWAPNGELEIVPSRRGTALRFELDGHPLGKKVGRWSIDSLRLGAHRLDISVDADGLLAHGVTTTVSIGRSEIQVPILLDDRATHRVRLVSRWTGTALALAGLGLVLHSALRDTSHLDEVMLCDPSCSRRSFATIGPFLEAPLGYSLMTTGLIWTGGGFLEGDRVDAPFWSLLVGSVVGAIAYGVSVLAN